ncbi:hypothetical protein SAMN05443574_10310 [Haloarcula vallismortis]|uniref:Uncharacterized protein n=2 Tax=Haloarcula vallismortis TaxID=28442 RepID=M0JQP1_HALVA|nr:hypothetical protein [Haloarcula vallismortis]EMA11311.1 hypothetical protein C437_00325 [Haloarcula vallismortis ATCC 29715]SDW37593.1 hypothetical protein SAMN05443574_10310 [Haloarcula vallismortis]
MPSSISNAVFSEPSGPRIALVHFAGSLVFSSLYVYAWVTEGSVPHNWLLAMVVGTGLAGVAEALPKHRRQMAGVLRSVAILVFLCLVGTAIIAPDLLST